MEGRCRTEGYEEGYYEGTGLVGGIAERVCCGITIRRGVEGFV